MIQCRGSKIQDLTTRNRTQALVTTYEENKKRKQKKVTNKKSRRLANLLDFFVAER
jgi:hypothetical protein